MTAPPKTITIDAPPSPTEPAGKDYADTVSYHTLNLIGLQSSNNEPPGGNSLSAGNTGTRSKSLQLCLIIASIVVGAVSLIISAEDLWTHHVLINEGMHTAVEAMGALAAIIMAMFLILKRYDTYGGKFFLLGVGFLGMGLIDVFHSVSPAGQGFVFLHSAASLIGALWFALIWLPASIIEGPGGWKTGSPWAVGLGAASLGIWVSLARSPFPTIAQNGAFTSSAVTINFIAGLLFLAAAIRLLLDFGRTGRQEFYLIAYIAMLFGLANLTFPSSSLWDMRWWFWHVLRLGSYILVLGFVIREHQQAISDLRVNLAELRKADEEVRKHRERLGDLVQERTAELTKANEGLQREMTDRKQIEQALLESEVRIQAILNNTTAVVYVKDTEGRYVLVNHQFENLFHVSANEIQGKNDYDLFPKDTADAFLANDRRVLELNRAMEFEEIVPEDGGRRVYISIKFPLQSTDGIPYGICGMSTDITERKQTEEHEISERKKAQDWLHTLISTTRDAVISIDRSSRIILFNPAAERIFGYTEAEVQGQKVNVLMDEPYASEHDGYIARFEQTNDPHAIGYLRTVTGRRKSGEAFPIEISITQIDDEEVHYAAFIRDVSEKKRLHDQLIENERLAAIGVTSAKFAHEIANPLNGMAMTTELLERRLARQNKLSDEKVSSALQAMNKEIKHLSVLLNDFRSLYRRETYHLKPMRLAAVIREALVLETPEYHSRGIQIEQHCPEDLPLVMADKGKLKQALLNLYRNAAEAMPGGGKITLRALGSSDQVILEIEDSGVGIPDGIDILEPFTTTKPFGTGLGLVIVRQIVAAHKGTMSYTSEVGKGTVFTLTLPAA